MTLEIKDACLSVEGQKQFEGLNVIVGEGEVKVLEHMPTTLFRAIQGLVPLDDGFITLDGELVTELSAGELRRYMAYVPLVVRWPDDEKNLLSAREMHQLLMERAVSDQKPIVLVEGVKDEAEMTLCQRMATDGSAVLVI